MIAASVDRCRRGMNSAQFHKLFNHYHNVRSIWPTGPAAPVSLAPAVSRQRKVRAVLLCGFHSDYQGTPAPTRQGRHCDSERAVHLDISGSA